MHLQPPLRFIVQPSAARERGCAAARRADSRGRAPSCAARSTFRGSGPCTRRRCGVRVARGHCRLGANTLVATTRLRLGKDWRGGAASIAAVKGRLWESLTPSSTRERHALGGARGRVMQTTSVPRQVARHASSVGLGVERGELYNRPITLSAPGPQLLPSFAPQLPRVSRTPDRYASLRSPTCFLFKILLKCPL